MVLPDTHLCHGSLHSSPRNHQDRNTHSLLEYLSTVPLRMGKSGTHPHPNKLPHLHKIHESSHMSSHHPNCCMSHAHKGCQSDTHQDQSKLCLRSHIQAGKSTRIR